MTSKIYEIKTDADRIEHKGYGMLKELGKVALYSAPACVIDAISGGFLPLHHWELDLSFGLGVYGGSRTTKKGIAGSMLGYLALISGNVAELLNLDKITGEYMPHLTQGALSLFNDSTFNNIESVVLKTALYSVPFLISRSKLKGKLP